VPNTFELIFKALLLSFNGLVASRELSEEYLTW